MSRQPFLLAAALLLIACDKPASETKGDAKPEQPAKPAEAEPAPQPEQKPAPAPRPKPAFMSEPERRNPKGELWADHERRELDVTGLVRRGPEGAAVTVVGCLDLVEPFTRRGQKFMAEAIAAFPDDVAFYPRPFTRQLQSTEEAIARKDADAIARRDRTLLVARALVAAEPQAKVWELHDAILPVDPKELTRDKLIELATQAGLDVEEFTAALDDPASLAAAEAHTVACEALGVRGTPTYFINGRKLDGAIPADAMKYLLELELHGGFEALPAAPEQ